MHDVRDLSKVLCLCLEPGLGPRKFGVFGHYLDWSETARFLNEITGRKLKTIRFPDAAFRVLGRLGDFLGNFNINFPLDLSTAEFMTTLVPGDDRETRKALSIEWRPLSDSFSDTLRWLAKNDFISAESIPAIIRSAN